MKIYSLDQHISVNTDVKTILERMGHTVDIDSLSGHSHIANRPKISIPWLEQGIYKIIEDRLWNRFYDEYAQKLEQYDAYLCCYPPAYALLYQKFNKPVIIDIPIRYNFPYVETVDGEPCTGWSNLNDLLTSNPLNIFVANNRLDQAYFEHFTGAKCEYIPSLCDYTGMKYNPVRPELLMYDGSRSFARSVKQCINRYDDCMQNHSWKDVQGFRAIAHMPYQFSTMSMFEQANAGIPLFYPSKEYLLDLYHGSADVLSQCFWTRGMKGKFSWDNMEVLLDLADYYQPEFAVEYFNSLGDLECMVDDDNLIGDMALMGQIKSDKLKVEVPEMWEKVLAKSC